MEVRVCTKNKCIASETSPLRLTRFLATFSGLQALLTITRAQEGSSLAVPISQVRKSRRQLGRGGSGLPCSLHLHHCSELCPRMKWDGAVSLQTALCEPWEGHRKVCVTSSRGGPGEKTDMWQVQFCRPTVLTGLTSTCGQGGLLSRGLRGKSVPCLSRLPGVPTFLGSWSLSLSSKPAMINRVSLTLYHSASFLFHFSGAWCLHGAHQINQDNPCQLKSAHY